MNCRKVNGNHNTIQWEMEALSQATITITQTWRDCRAHLTAEIALIFLTPNENFHEQLTSNLITIIFIIIAGIIIFFKWIKSLEWKANLFI